VADISDGIDFIFTSASVRYLPQFGNKTLKCKMGMANMSDLNTNGKLIDTQPTVRLHGLSYAVVALASGIGIFLMVNQIFNLRIGGFQPIGTAYYYYILACYLSISFLIFSGGE